MAARTCWQQQAQRNGHPEAGKLALDKIRLTGHPRMFMGGYKGLLLCHKIGQWINAAGLSMRDKRLLGARNADFLRRSKCHLWDNKKV
ncbi:MAG TPA: hypothetical protein ENJ91_01630 [Rhodobacteraceae bacterium]|nr:hypothetical protein [Paracoccaceae bacterium]